MKSLFQACFVLLSLFSCNQDVIQFEIAVDIFPNPCIDQVFITAAPGVVIDTQTDANVKVLDAKENEVIAVFPFSQTLNVVNMSDREPGEYYVQLEVGSSILSTDVFIKSE